MTRATSLLIGLAFCMSLAACESEAPSASPSAELPLPSAGAAIVPGCDLDTEDESGWLTGVWEASDEGLYYLRDTDDGCIWWFGTDAGRTSGTVFSNVAVGRIDGDVIHLQYADVPYGDLLGGGTLTLQVSADGNQLTKIATSGSFGGATWTRLVDLPSPGPTGSPAASASP